MTALLSVNGLTKDYGAGWHVVRAVDDVSFTMERGETLALVGESGCGKSTIGRCVVNLVTPTAGSVSLNGTRIDHLSERRMRPLRRQVQLVFQDPIASLDPRQRIGDAIAEPMRNFRTVSPSEIDGRVADLLAKMGLSASTALRFPHEFSGGQRQRICIARAMASDPDLLVCDEAVAALDVSVRAQVVNLLRALQQTLGIGILFISHDLAIVENIAHRVAVMYFGALVEVAERSALFRTPRHPYTKAMLAAIPIADPALAVSRRASARPAIEHAEHPATGCRFRLRCPAAFERCQVERPTLRQIAFGHLVACHLDS